MSALLRRHRARRPDTGASAVEFALLALPLFLILFGIIDYGIWFSDSISARQAVRDGARRGVVESFGTCPGATGELANLACTVRNAMEPISGKAYVKISVVTGPGGGSGPWAVGGTLRVCALSQHTSLMPLVPFPAGGISRTKVEMPIEQSTGTASSRTSFTDLSPGGAADWTSNNWCP